jgi:hypothetical protein
MLIFKMDAIDDDFTDNRKWRQVDNGDGTISLVDETEYQAKGTEFGAAEYNSLCAAVQGFTTSTTYLSDDGNTITEVDANNRKKVTVIGADSNGATVITETLYDEDETKIAVKTTTFSLDNTTIREEVVKA